MQINVQIPKDEMVQAVVDGITKVLNHDFDPREPYQVISDAIRDGVAKAISEKLSKRWGDDLIEAIAESVAKATAGR